MVAWMATKERGLLHLSPKKSARVSLAWVTLAAAATKLRMKAAARGKLFWGRRGRGSGRKEVSVGSHSALDGSAQARQLFGMPGHMRACGPPQAASHRRGVRLPR